MTTIDTTTYALCKKLITSALTGVSDFTLNGNTINITTKDGKTFNVDLPVPKDGISVSKTKIDENNNLVFEMSDGSVQIAGALPVGEVITDKLLSDESENPIANKVVAEEINNISSELDNTVKLKKNTQIICKEDVEGMPMNAITIDTNVDSGYLKLSPKEIGLSRISASDVTASVKLSGSDGITLYDVPITFGAYRAEDKMKIKDNYIQSDTTVNISTISSSPSLTSKIRISPTTGSLAMSEVKSSYESPASATGTSSIAIGSTSKASGQNSVAIGKKATSSGTNSIAVGDGNYMGSWYYYTQVSGNNSIGVGTGLKSAYDNQAVWGKFNKNQEYNLFEVGNGNYTFPMGVYSETRQNAFSVDAEGNVFCGQNVVSNGTIKLNSTLSIMSSESQRTMQDKICAALYKIVDYLRTQLHIENASTVQNVFYNYNVGSISEFDFIMETSTYNYVIKARVLPRYVRSAPSFNCEFSWHEITGDENRCVISVSGTQSLIDPLPYTVKIPQYAVGKSTEADLSSYVKNPDNKSIATKIELDMSQNIQNSDTGYINYIPRIKTTYLDGTTSFVSLPDDTDTRMRLMTPDQAYKLEGLTEPAFTKKLIGVLSTSTTNSNWYESFDIPSSSGYAPFLIWGISSQAPLSGLWYLQGWSEPHVTPIRDCSAISFKWTSPSSGVTPCFSVKTTSATPINIYKISLV